jgi:hypothetical protein
MAVALSRCTRQSESAHTARRAASKWSQGSPRRVRGHTWQRANSRVAQPTATARQSGRSPCPSHARARWGSVRGQSRSNSVRLCLSRPASVRAGTDMVLPTCRQFNGSGWISHVSLCCGSLPGRNLEYLHIPGLRVLEPRGQLDEPAESVDQAYLLGRSTGYLEKCRAAHQYRQAART